MCLSSPPVFSMNIGVQDESIFISNICVFLLQKYQTHTDKEININIAKSGLLKKKSALCKSRTFFETN